jgi:hypothetical protein
VPKSAIEWSSDIAGVGGGVFAIAVFGLDFPNGAGGVVGGVGGTLMMIGGFGTIALRGVERRSRRRGTA